MDFNQTEFESCSNCGAIFDIKKMTRCPTCGTPLEQKAPPTSYKVIRGHEKERIIDFTSIRSLSLIRSKNRREFEIFDQNKTRLMYSNFSFKFGPLSIFRLFFTVLRAKHKEIPIYELRDVNHQLLGRVFTQLTSGGTSSGSIRNSTSEVIATYSGRWGINFSSPSPVESEIDAFQLETASNRYTVSFIRERTENRLVSRVDLLDKNKEICFSVKPMTKDQFIIHFSDTQSTMPLLIVGTTSFAITSIFFASK